MDRRRVRIGGFIGTRLVVAGRSEVSAVACDATLAAPREHGWRMKIGAPTPNVDTLLDLSRLFGRVRGLYRETE